MRPPMQPDYAILAVFVLSALAIAVGSLYASNAGQGLLWTAALVPWVGILVWRGADPLWLAGLSAGLAAGLATGIVQAAFAPVYAANHPADVVGSGFGMWARFVGFALAAGGAWGLLAAGIAWGVKKAL